jgi:guanylate kinase
MERDPRYEFVRSVTTRPSRGDAYDAEYIYITVDEFRELIANGGVLEHTEYAGNFYGTPRSEVKRILAEGKIPLLVLDINGVESIERTKGELNPCGVYVYDTLNVAEQRLYDRFVGDNPTPEGLSKFVGRKEKNIQDFFAMPEHCGAFFAFIHNCGTVADATCNVEAEFKRFCEGGERDGAAIEKIAAELSASAQEKNVG